MKREMEIDFIVGRLRNNPTNKEAEYAADLIIDLYRECVELELRLDKSTQDYWSR